ncbi:MAG: N-formylglutamate amidohydrolase [Gammaproteobacteria bacterium]
MEKASRYKTLLNETEPALFETRRLHARAPLIICCDHAGRRIPDSLGALGLPPEALDLHIACDIGARQVALLLAQKFNAPLLLANYSRLVIDLNRHLNDPTLIPVASDGIVIPGNAALSHAQRARRIRQLFLPYHQCYRRMVDALQSRAARPLIIALHSFAAEMHGRRRPWDFGLLWDEHAELAHTLSANLRRNPDLCIGQNQPYHARRPLGYAMVEHAQARGVEMALVEIRQDHLAGRRGQEWAADILFRAVASVVAELPDDAPALRAG